MSKAKSLTGFPGDTDGKKSVCNAGDLGSIPRLGTFPGGRHGNPLHDSCLKNPHGQRILAGYRPKGQKDSDTTEQLSTTTKNLVGYMTLIISPR